MLARRAPFTFSPSEEERDQPHVVFLFEGPVPKAKRQAIANALPSAFAGLYELEWLGKNKLALEAQDSFVWDIFDGPAAEASFDKTLRAFAAAVEGIAPLAAITDTDGSDGDLRTLVAVRSARGAARVRAIVEAIEAGHDRAVRHAVDALIATPEEHRIDAMKEAPSPRLLLDGVLYAFDRLGPVAVFQALSARRVVSRLPYALAVRLEPEEAFEERRAELGAAWRVATPAVREALARLEADDGPRELFARAAVLAAGEAWGLVIALFGAAASHAARDGTTAQERRLQLRAEVLYRSALEALGRTAEGPSGGQPLPPLDLATVGTGIGLAIRGKVTRTRPLATVSRKGRPDVALREGLLDDGTGTMRFTLWGPRAEAVADGDELVCEDVVVKYEMGEPNALGASRAGHVIVIGERSTVRLASGASLEGRGPSESVADITLGILDYVTAPLWREAVARIQQTPDAELFAAARACDELKVGGKPFGSLPRAAILATLEDPMRAKLAKSLLPAAFGAPFRMLGDIDLELAERLCPPVLARAPANGRLASMTAMGLARSTNDASLAAVLERLVTVTDSAAQKAGIALAHPGTTLAVLREAERIAEELAPRPRSGTVDFPPAGEEARTYAVAALLEVACGRDDKAVARTRFLAWRSRGGVLALAALKGLAGLLTPKQCSAKGIRVGPTDRVNDPRLETYAPLLV